jgi:hypothetical protein
MRKSPKAVRETQAALEQQMTAAADVRDAADDVSLNKVQLVVNGVVGDPVFGEDSALYESIIFSFASHLLSA